MSRKGWYLIAYDIACPKRLSKVHKIMKKECIAVQYSLFFHKASVANLDVLLDRVAETMNLCEDDLRAYPIIHPEAVWTKGRNPIADFPIIYFDAGSKKERKQRIRNWWMKFLNF